MTMAAMRGRPVQEEPQKDVQEDTKDARTDDVPVEARGFENSERGDHDRREQGHETPPRRAPPPPSRANGDEDSAHKPQHTHDDEDRREDL
jgi:hypothetical protein